MVETKELERSIPIHQNESSQGAKVEHFDVSNVIYHKFSHWAVSYMLNGENVNIKLDYGITFLISHHRGIRAPDKKG